MEATQKAVGFVRLTQGHLNPNQNGLASIRHPAPAATATAKVETVGELRGQSRGGEDESVEEEPLSIAQMEFCVFNETNEESVFWDAQTLAEAGAGTVKGIYKFRDAPPSAMGPCWNCNQLCHQKRQCPGRQT